MDDLAVLIANVEQSLKDYRGKPSSDAIYAYLHEELPQYTDEQLKAAIVAINTRAMR